MHKGSCLCGAVRYEVDGDLRQSVSCHCGQCRKTSGHYWSATSSARADFTITNDIGLTWFQSSPEARRGFCNICGSSLFWDPRDEDHMSIACGTLDGPTGIRETKHIYVADKGDYYDIPAGVPQKDIL